jgi:hypothetical protein
VFKKQWLAFVLAFVVPLVAVFAWWGGFATVSVRDTEAGPYRYAYLDYEGPISNMRKTQRTALKKFDLARVPAGDTITVLFTDPRADHGKVRAHVGYVLGESDPVPEGLQAATIARRPVVQATVHAAVLLGPSKAYEALDERGLAITMPTVERYRPAGQANRIGTFSLEMNR